MNKKNYMWYGNKRFCLQRIDWKLFFKHRMDDLITPEVVLCEKTVSLPLY